MLNRTLVIFGINQLFTFSAHAFDFNFQKAIDFAQKAQQATKSIEEPEEIEIGHGIAAKLLGASSLLADSKVQQYVNQVGRWLSLQTERPDLPWQFGVLASTDINAFATPGGTIFITNGLLQKLNNESEFSLQLLLYEQYNFGYCTDKTINTKTGNEIEWVYNYGIEGFNAEKQTFIVHLKQINLK